MDDHFFGVRTIGEFSKAWRKKHGVSQQQLADALVPPKSKSTVNSIELEANKLPFSYIKSMYHLLDDEEKVFLKKLIAHIAISEIEE